MAINILSITEARNKFFEISDNVQKEGTYYMLTERGAPKVVIMSAEEFDSWQETFDAEKDFSNLKKDIEKVDCDIKTGAYKKYTLLEDVLAKEGFILADKAKKLYGIQRKARKKGGKRIKKNF